MSVNGIQGYENINIRIFKDRDVTNYGKHYIEVEIRGRKKTRCLSKGRVYLNEEKVLHRVMVVAGALAERQNEELGEDHDPDKCANAAKSSYLELKKQLENKNINILPGVENIG